MCGLLDERVVLLVGTVLFLRFYIHTVLKLPLLLLAVLG